MIHNKMTTYGHMAPQYPYNKDDMSQYGPNSYTLNPSRPLNSPGPNNSHFHPGNNYGSVPPRHDSHKYNSYEKDLSPSHVDYNQAPWPNGSRSDVPPDYYSRNLPSGSSHSFKSDANQDSFAHQTYNPDHGSHLHQNSWDTPVANQYSNVRLAIFVENCNCVYELVESDLRELFSYYSGVRSLSISPDYPAAELIVTDPAASGVAASELNGIVLHGIGTLRCVVMRQGQTLESVLSSANIYQNYNKAPSAGTASTAVDTTASRYAYLQNDQAGSKNSNLMLARKSQSPAGTPKAMTRPLMVNNVEHVSGMTNKTNTKRQARFELIELFSYEPDFDVTSSILGPNNANIEYIMKNSNNKVDISIKGKPLNSAPVADRLHLSITANDFYPYNKAIFMVEDLLSSVCEKFVDYVRERGKVVSNLVGFRRHEYEEDANGVLDYKGYIDKPKTWLEGNPRRNLPYNKPRTNYAKKVNDRSRPISNNRPQNTRMANTSKSRNVRK